MLFTIFGLPGSGKTFVGEIFKKYFDFYFYDGDADLPEDMKIALAHEQDITSDMRNRFFNRLINTTKGLYQRQKKLVIAQTFIQEKYRAQFLTEIPKAKFVLVTTDNQIREHRLRKRNDYSLEYLRSMVRHFESPKIACKVIDNNQSGEESVKKQIAMMLE